jgi:hypothetical protein
VGAPRDEWITTEFSNTARQVCQANCNGGWMNDLENEARPALEPMIQGRGLDLNEDGQAAVAAWGAKTALVFNLTVAAKPAPVEHYREMERTHRPPRQSLVWLAGYRGSHAAYTHPSVLEFDLASGRTIYGYATTLAIGHLVFQVVGYSGIEDDLTIPKVATWAQATEQIWPLLGAIVSWPPPLVLDDAGLEALAVDYERARPT